MSSALIVRRRSLTALMAPPTMTQDLGCAQLVEVGDSIVEKE
jgi:hypothetical protein